MKGGKEEGIKMQRKEGRRNKKRKKDRKEEGIKRKSSEGFNQVRPVLLVVLSVKWEGVGWLLEQMVSLFPLHEPHSLLLSSLQSSSSGSFCSPLGL